MKEKSARNERTESRKSHGSMAVNWRKAFLPVFVLRKAQQSEILAQRLEILHTNSSFRTEPRKMSHLPPAPISFLIAFLIVVNWAGQLQTNEQVV